MHPGTDNVALFSMSLSRLLSGTDRQRVEEVTGCHGGDCFINDPRTNIHFTHLVLVSFYRRPRTRLKSDEMSLQYIPRGRRRYGKRINKFTNSWVTTFGDYNLNVGRVVFLGEWWGDVRFETWHTWDSHLQLSYVSCTVGWGATRECRRGLDPGVQNSLVTCGAYVLIGTWRRCLCCSLARGRTDSSTLY